MVFMRWISVILIAGYLPFAVADQSTAVPHRELVVVTKDAPPFAIKSDDGSWSGISIDLWREIAAIASALMVGELATGIRGPQDLYHSHTGSVKNASSAAYLDDRHIAYTNFNTVQQGLAALTRGEIDAFIYDQPLLQCSAKTEFQG